MENAATKPKKSVAKLIFILPPPPQCDSERERQTDSTKTSSFSSSLQFINALIPNTDVKFIHYTVHLVINTGF
jgi:hypothetical protein